MQPLAIEDANSSLIPRCATRWKSVGTEKYEGQIDNRLTVTM